MDAHYVVKKQCPQDSSGGITLFEESRKAASTIGVAFIFPTYTFKRPVPNANKNKP